MLTLDPNTFGSRPAAGSKRLYNPSIPSQTVESPHCCTDFKSHTRRLRLPHSDSARLDNERKNEVRKKDVPNEWKHPGITTYTTAPFPPCRDEAHGSEEPCLLSQPEARSITHEQLAVEVKGIYAGLVMVEAKCIEVDEKQSATTAGSEGVGRTKLGSEQWQALIALHRTLLHEHHNFFLASQHPSASPALTRLATKYNMPARMWRNGIHAFLELLRHRLPESLDHMLAFIYIAYSMMALLYETVPAFEDTWIECLGDLGRYRIAIEDDGVRDHETWSGVAKFWYCKAADKSSNVGRLYHHLAILARPFTPQQLSLYTKSLTCVLPLKSWGDSVWTLFTAVLNGQLTQRNSTSRGVLIALAFYATPFRFRSLVGVLEAISSKAILETSDMDGTCPGHSLPEDFLMRGQLWSKCYFRETWFDDVDTDDEERTFGLSSIDRPRIESVLGLGRRAFDNNTWFPYKLRWRSFKSRVFKAIEFLSAARSSSNSALRALTWSISLHYVSAAAIPRTSTDTNVNHEWPIGSALPSLSSWPYVFVGSLVLAITYFLARRSYAPRVWGIMMAIFSLVWLVIEADITTTYVVRWTTFAQGTFSTTRFATTQFRTYRMGQGYALLTCVMALAIDYFIARALQPDPKFVSSDNLIRFLFPSFGLSLLFTTYCGSLSHTP